MSANPTVTVSQAMELLDDRRVKSVRPLIPPQILIEELPLSLSGAQTILTGRLETENIINKTDDRLLVIIGPCSIHDTEQALEYAEKLVKYKKECKDELLILMRVYFEKPRTTVGWKGLINDPDMNGTFAINRGLRKGRKLLLDLAEMGMPTACEFLDTITPQFSAELVSWGAIGARTTESQVHRELASALSCSVGFKNGTDGSIDIAIDAMRAAASSHTFLSVTKHGLSAIVETEGNPFTHVILRGSSHGPNFEKEHVQGAAAKLTKAGLSPKLMIDCSHGNSMKLHLNQIKVAKNVREQLEGDETSSNIMGVMIESHLNEGRQNIPEEGPSALKYGVSITDACVSWEQTVPMLEDLRAGIRARRANVAAKKRAAGAEGK